jgi:hypothetical protein
MSALDVRCAERRVAPLPFAPAINAWSRRPKQVF